ncbi:hypothetical protein HSX11_08565 [Oxalobacteraceae bacterium]|nr:hypothetical protein [Oxalobacteraceae bacterium]
MIGPPKPPVGTGSAATGSGEPGAIILHSVAQPNFQVLLHLPVEQPCPLMAKLNGYLNLLYLYADGTPVTKANFTIEAAVGSPLGAGALGGDGRGRLYLPKTASYLYYFDQDKAPDGSIFQFFPAYSEQVPAFNAAIADWNPTLAAQGKDSRRQLRWGNVALAKAPENLDRPVLEKFLRHIVDQAVALPGQAALQREAAQILLAMLLGSHADQALWARLVLNRAAAAPGQRSRLLQELCVLMANPPAQLAERLTVMLNSAGKGNAVGFYRTFATDMAGIQAAVAAHIDGLLNAIRTQLGKIKNAATAGLWNQATASELLAQLDDFPATATRVDAVLGPVAQGIRDGFATHPPYCVRSVGVFERENVYRQVEFAFPKYQPGPVVLPRSWFEAQFLYANDAPVAKAKLVYEDTLLKDGGKEIETDEHGFAFISIPTGKSYELHFHSDPNDYVLLDAHLLKARVPDLLGTGMLDEAIGAAKFGAGMPALCWGDTDFTDNEGFKLAPTLSQLVSAIVQNRSAHPPSADDHKEMRALFYPLLMGKLLPQLEQDALWQQVAMQRLGSCTGPQGALIRDMLFRLQDNAEAKVEQALEWLNSVGQGNAYLYLSKLHGEAANHEKSVVDNLLAMLDDLDSGLGKLTGADDAVVLPLHKRYCKDVALRLAELKLLVADKIQAALAPAWARLDAVRQQAQPQYGAAAVLMDLTVCKQKSQALLARPAALAPELDWIELEYLHPDDAPVADAEYLVLDEAGTTKLYKGKLDGGYAHLVLPKGLKFQYRFRRDQAFVPDPAWTSLAPSLPALAADFLDLAIAADKLKVAPGFFSWDDAALSDQVTFELAPTCAKVAHHCVLLHTNRVAHKDDEAALAKLLGPLIQQAGDMPALWTTVVFHALGMLDLPEGRVLQGLLHYLDVDGVTATVEELIKRVNSAGKGNGARLLEKLNGDMGAHKTSIQAHLKLVLQQFKTECDKIVTGDVTKFDAGIQAYAKLLKDGIDALDVDQGVDSIFAPLEIALEQKLLAVKVTPLLGKLGGVNQLKQAMEALKPFAAPAAVLKPWFGILYLHADLTPVAAKCIVTDDTAVQIADTQLSAAGASFHHGLDSGKSFTFRFHKESAFAIDAGMQSQATTLVALAPNLTTMVQKHFDQFNLNNGVPYGWGDTGLANMAEFESGPHLGRICRNVVRANTAFLSKPADPKDELEMSEMLRFLILENQHADLRVWSIVAMNRIATAHADGLLRRAVLLRLQFDDPFPGTLAKDLVAMLNAAGKGHAVEWLLALLADLNTLRDAAITNCKTILDTVKTEVLKLNRVPLSGYVKGRAVTLGAQALVAHGVAEAKIKLVIDPLTVKLTTLFGGAAKFLLPSNALLNQMNVFVQPMKKVQECSPDCIVAPAWPLDRNVELQYLYADGTPIVGANYVLESGAGVSLFTGLTVAQGKSGNKLVPAGTSVMNYLFGNDPQVYVVKPAVEPWPNPYVALPLGYANTAALTNVLFAGPALPAGTLTVGTQAAFNLAPSLGRMISDAVIRNTINVSGAGDVQDLGAVVQNLIADPPVATDDTWFRAGVNGLGSIAAVGSVLRGLFLFFRYKPPVDAATLLALMNWAGKGNVARWLKLQTLDAHIQTAVTRLINVLDTLNARLEELRVHVQVHADIQLQIAEIQVRIGTARAQADAEIKAQLALQRAELDALLQTKKLWLKFPAGPLTLNTYKQKVDEFLECNDQLASACKTAIDLAATNSLIAANAPFAYTLLNPPGPPPGGPQGALFNVDAHAWKALSQYQLGTRGGAGKSLAPILSQASKASFVTSIEAATGVTLAAVRLAPPSIVNAPWTVTLGSWSGGEMWFFEHSDGTLIRYKPDGDAFMKPPCATYSIELIKDTALGWIQNLNNPLANTAFKIDGQGYAVPKGPTDKVDMLNCPCGNAHPMAEANKHFLDHLMKSGHRSLRF